MARTLRVTVEFVPEHFNPRCGCNIPESWKAEVVSGLPRQAPGCHEQYYALSATELEAVQDLCEQLRSRFAHCKVTLIK